MSDNITKKQLEEIEFLEKNYKVSSTPEERLDYIDWSVHGKTANVGGGGISGGKSNSLMEAKRKLDIDIKSWREDLTRGLLSVEELKEDFNSAYGNRLVDSIIDGVTREYRKKILAKGPYTILVIENFPKLIATFEAKFGKSKNLIN